MQYEKYLNIQKRQQRAKRILHDLVDHMTTVQLLLEQGDLGKAQSYVYSYRFKE